MQRRQWDVLVGRRRLSCCGVGRRGGTRIGVEALGDGMILRDLLAAAVAHAARTGGKLQLGLDLRQEGHVRVRERLVVCSQGHHVALGVGALDPGGVPVGWTLPTLMVRRVGPLW